MYKAQGEAGEGQRGERERQRGRRGRRGRGSNGHKSSLLSLSVLLSRLDVHSCNPGTQETRQSRGDFQFKANLCYIQSKAVVFF